MPDFERPGHLERAGMKWESLGVLAFGYPPLEDLEAMNEVLGGEEHLRLVVPFDDADERRWTLRGTIGVHPHPGEGEADPWFHLDLTVTDGSADLERGKERWEALLGLMRKREIGARMRGRLLAAFPDLSGFAFPLPMPLDSIGIAGFSEIRGVRLIESDPEDAETDLYSVIIDGGNKHAYADVSASLESDFGTGLFSAVARRCMSVLELAISPNAWEVENE